MPGVARAQQLSPTLVAECPGTDSQASFPSCAFLCPRYSASPAVKMPTFPPDLSSLLPLVPTAQTPLPFLPSACSQYLVALGVEGCILLAEPLSSMPACGPHNACLFLSPLQMYFGI
ncbi:hypothetical protein H1C71_015704 [Ictidomys tridecemlineatus]|nr:hypothetical protein H1C71_015704 [Ictidomys tridecemlineatus]